MIYEFGGDWFGRGRIKRHTCEAFMIADEDPQKHADFAAFLHHRLVEFAIAEDECDPADIVDYDHDPTRAWFVMTSRLYCRLLSRLHYFFEESLMIFEKQRAITHPELLAQTVR
jgi:hypothetical protein